MVVGGVVGVVGVVGHIPVTHISGIVSAVGEMGGIRGVGITVDVGGGIDDVCMSLNNAWRTDIGPKPKAHLCNLETEIYQKRQGATG